MTVDNHRAAASGEESWSRIKERALVDRSRN
jgi:hypothetical protein